MNDIYEIRRHRLRQLIDERFNGVVLHLAQAIGMKSPQLHRWLSLTSKDRRRMEWDSARAIEEKLGLIKGSLDEPDASLSSIEVVSEQEGNCDQETCLLLLSDIFFATCDRFDLSPEIAFESLLDRVYKDETQHRLAERLVRRSFSHLDETYHAEEDKPLFGDDHEDKEEGQDGGDRAA